MPNSVKNQNLKKITGQILEPFALGLLALLFIIPALTVFNLTPITKTLEKLNVLGINTGSSVNFTLVEGKHDIIKSEFLIKNDENDYTYSTTLIKRASDNYSKPILEIENKTEEQKTLVIYGQTKSSTKSNISLIINDKSYKLQDDSNFTYPQEIQLDPGSKYTVFLSVENLSGVQFSEDFEMQLKIKTEL